MRNVAIQGKTSPTKPFLIASAGASLSLHCRFIVASVCWQGHRRIQQIVLHIDLIGDKVWIQRDGAEDGIADELEAAGIPTSHIVLAFHRFEDRALLPEYATS